MKEKMIVVAIAIAVIFALAACKSQPQSAVPTPAEIKKEQNSLNVDTQPLRSRILDWSNRNMGQIARPPWLTSLTINGNSQMVRQEFGINNNAIVRFTVIEVANRDEARLLNELQFNRKIALELKTYVEAGGGTDLNQGQRDTIERTTAATKVNITGLRSVTDFWQLVETTDDRSGARSRVYNYWVVWSIEDNIWQQLVAKYLRDVIGQIPDRQVQVNLANAFDEITAASRRETEVSDRDFQRIVDERLREVENAQEREMARIRSGTQVNIAQAEAAARAAEAESRARYAAYRSGNPTVAAIASATSDDISWLRALSTAARVNN